MKEFISQVVTKFSSLDDLRVNWEFLKHKKKKTKKTADTID